MIVISRDIKIFKNFYRFTYLPIYPLRVPMNHELNRVRNTGGNGTSSFVDTADVFEKDNLQRR